jgi:hypothetical protein
LGYPSTAWVDIEVGIAAPIDGTFSTSPPALSGFAISFAMASSSSSKVPVAEAETFPDGTTDHIPLRKKNYDVRKPRTLPALERGQRIAT